jgi:hypothetical protein
MDLLPIFQSLEATGLGRAVRESLWLFPVIECVHLLALALLGGSILVVDLRLLGLGLTAQPVDDLARRLHPWLAGSLFLLIATGIPMFLSEALKCFYSPPFWVKIGLLCVAALFTFTIRRRVLARPAPPLLAASTALVSLALWFGVGFAGRWIAFY